MSRTAYKLLAAARSDLLEVWNYLAGRASLAVADRVAREIEKAIQRLVKNPGHGHFGPDLTDRDVRFFRVFSYLIVYRADLDALHVIRVLHAARDVHRILNDADI